MVYGGVYDARSSSNSQVRWVQMKKHLVAWWSLDRGICTVR